MNRHKICIEIGWGFTCFFWLFLTWTDTRFVLKLAGALPVSFGSFSLEPTQDLYWNLLSIFGSRAQEGLNRHKICIEIELIPRLIKYREYLNRHKICIEMHHFWCVHKLLTLEPTQDLYWNFNRHERRKVF